MIERKEIKMISLNWVKDYIDINDVNAYDLADRITKAGVNVEKIITHDIPDLAVGKVLTCVNHPDSDHLHVTTVDVGSETLQIVCGAPNVRAGLKVIVALPGANLPGDFKIKPSTIRGVESNGMLCALYELGLVTKTDEEYQKGIYELGEDAVIGSNPLTYLGMDDTLYDLDIHKHRNNDCYGHIPFAYEVGTILNRKITLPNDQYSVINDNINNYIINTTTAEQAYSSDDELKNKWQDKYNEYIEKISAAVNNTNNLVIKYDQQLIKSYYYAMSNGYTEDSQAVFNESYPYLNVISSSFDSESNNYQVTKNFSREDFCKQLNIDCSSIVISNIIKDNSNRVSTLNINNQEFSGITLRKLLNLRSTDFNINTDNNDIEITTKGYGHGVGMSQYGANYLANNGLNYQEILKYYYQNIEIDNY